jgi:hypothetical protein
MDGVDLQTFTGQAYPEFCVNEKVGLLTTRRPAYYQKL